MKSTILILLLIGGCSVASHEKQRVCRATCDECKKLVIECKIDSDVETTEITGT